MEELAEQQKPGILRVVVRMSVDWFDVTARNVPWEAMSKNFNRNAGHAGAIIEGCENRRRNVGEHPAAGTELKDTFIMAAPDALLVAAKSCM